jgi:hypothetical protein
VHTSCVEGECFYGWIPVFSLCIRFCSMALGAFFYIVVFGVLWWYVGCGLSGFGSSFCSDLEWFVCI